MTIFQKYILKAKIQVCVALKSTLQRPLKFDPGLSSRWAENEYGAGITEWREEDPKILVRFKRFCAVIFGADVWRKYHCLFTRYVRQFKWFKYIAAL